MKWFDYVVCIFIADVASAILISGHVWMFWIPALAYLSYEQLRAE